MKKEQNSFASEQEQFLQACCDAGLWSNSTEPEGTPDPVAQKPEDQVERIAIQFHRVMKIHRDTPIDQLPNPMIWDYKEQLSIDRASGILEQVQRIGEKCVVSHKYYVPEEIANLLDRLDIAQLFEPSPESPDDLIENSDDHRFYKMKIAFQRHPPCKCSGYFDRYGLPSYWPELMDDVLDFIRFYGNGKIVSPFLYSAARRRKSDYIFCSVEFEEYGNTYYYLTTDDTIKPGDRVLVPVGKTNAEKAVTVTEVEYFQADQAPFPLEKTKSILRKLEPDEADEYEKDEEPQEILHQGIRRLQTALVADNEDRTEETLLEILYALRCCIAKNETLLIPVETLSAFNDMIDPDRIKPGDVVEAQEDLHFKLRTVMLGSGEKAFAAFTSITELEKWQKTSSISCNLPDFFNSTIETPDIAGIVLNPWGASFYLSKSMLTMILDISADTAENLNESESTSH